MYYLPATRVLIQTCEIYLPSLTKLKVLKKSNDFPTYLYLIFVVSGNLSLFKAVREHYLYLALPSLCFRRRK